MKKLLVVLTILVLVAGFAFADISGKVSASYTFGFSQMKDDEGEVSVFSAGYSKPGTTSLDATFSLDSQSAGFTGENMPYVDLAVTASISGYYNFSDEHGYVWSGVKYVYLDDDFEPQEANKLYFSLSVKTFKIVGEDWEINLKNSEGARTDFAVSAIDSKTFHKYTIDQNTAYYSFSNNVYNATGVSVTYKGYVAGIGYNNPDIKNEKADITLEVKTPEFVFGDMTVQAGAGFSQERLLGGVEKKGGVSAKVAYATDSVKASVGVDALKASGKDIAFDLAANVTVAPVTADVYYANASTFAYSSKKIPYTSTPTAKAELKELLSAKVVVALGDVVENVPVKLTFTGKDLLKKNVNYTSWSAAVNTTAIENFDITLTVGGLQAKEKLNIEAKVKYTGIENLTLTGTAMYRFNDKLAGLTLVAEYEAEKYTAECDLLYATDFTNSFFGIYALVETDKLIEGATLAAELSGVDLGVTLDSSLGFVVDGAALTLSCTVEF